MTGVQTCALPISHCYDDASGELGAIIVGLGDVYLRLAPQVWNVATLVLHLYFPQLDIGRGPLAGAEVDQYEAVEADLLGYEARLDRVASTRPDAALIVDEVRNAIALVRVLCADARARLAVGGALESVDATPRQDLARQLRPVISEHVRLWNLRNRPGGLRESRAWLEHLLDCYESGVTDRGWSGPL